MNEELHTPGKLKYDADWRELKAENGYVVARLPAADHGLRGKDHIEALASIKANGERLAALWNAALLSHIAKGEQARAVGVPDAAAKRDYCPEKLKPGGCQLHNLHCGFPKCNEPASPTTAGQQAVQPASVCVHVRTDGVKEGS